MCFTREQTEFPTFVKDSLISLVTRYEWIYHSSVRNLAWISRKKEILINKKDLIIIHYPQKYAGDSGSLFWAQAWTHTFRRENWTNKTTLTLSLFILVPRQESKRSCLCVLGKSILSLFQIFLVDFGFFPTFLYSWLLCYWFNTQIKIRIHNNWIRIS